MSGKLPKISFFARHVAPFFLCLVGMSFLSGASNAQTPPRTLTYSQGWSQCATEGNVCWFPGMIRDVAYGANGGYIYLLAIKDNVKCTNGEFWDSDPKPGVSKACYIYNGPSRLAASEMCAGENGTCSVTGPRTIWFGSAGQFSPKVIYQDDSATTLVACNSANFGGDPNRGLAKYCLKTP